MEKITAAKIMEEKICTHKSTDCELESIDTLEKYYSVEFSLNSKGPAYIFRLRDISLNCPSILVKEDSSVLEQMKVGDILNMGYGTQESSGCTKFLKTQIISKGSHHFFKGHSLIELSVLDEHK